MNNKYYVGKTTSLDRRLMQHINGVGAVWCKKHPVIEMCLARPMRTIYDEDQTVLEFMNKYGIDNVRGGTWVRETLTDDEIDLIKKMMDTIYDTCFKCHRYGHFAVNCPGSRQCKRRKTSHHTYEHFKTCGVCHTVGHLDKDCPTKPGVNDRPLNRS